MRQLRRPVFVQTKCQRIEYRNAVQYMNQGGQAYRPAGAGSMTQTDACNVCSNLICMDCLCEMMGGDCIPCC